MPTIPSPLRAAARSVAPLLVLLLVAAALLGVPARASDAPAAVESGVFFPETATLDNGLDIIVVRNDTAPVVTHMVWYNVGSADDPPGKSGLAHYTEHLMFLGSENYPGQAFNRIVKENGASNNAFTSWDYTAYFESVAADRLELMMKLEADRMANLVIDPVSAANELSVVVEERRQRTDDSPRGRLWEQLFATLFQNHPYQRPIIGWAREIDGLTPADAQAFYDRWYAPNNATLIVAGDVTLEEVVTLAERTYGLIPARPVPERVRPPEPEMATERRVILRDAEVLQPAWNRLHLIDGPRSNLDELIALDVAEEAVGGQTGPIHRALVVERELAVSAGLFVQSFFRDYAAVGVWATPAPGVSVETIEAAMEEELARLLDEGVSADDVARARDRLLLDATLARDSVSGPANALGRIVAMDRPIDDVERWPERIAAVTTEDVMAALRASLDRSRSVTGLLLPLEGADG